MKGSGRKSRSIDGGVDAGFPGHKCTIIFINYKHNPLLELDLYSEYARYRDYGLDRHCGCAETSERTGCTSHGHGSLGRLQNWGYFTSSLIRRVEQLTAWQ